MSDNKLDPMVIAAAARHNFRPRRTHEPAETYRLAVIDHVESFDFAAAHELRVGRPQAEWTADDVDAFSKWMLGHRGLPRRELRPGTAVVGLEYGPFPVNVEQLFELATFAVDAIVAMRQEKPEASVPIVASVFLLDGRVMSGFVQRADRYAYLKSLTRNEPTFGFFLVADVFVHGVDLVTHRATKRDEIICHIGTREKRWMRRRPYTVVDGRVTFEANPPADLDLAGEGMRVSDPYADIFVSVPEPTGKPS